MSLTPHVQEELSQRGYSRRQIARIALGAAAVILFVHEFAFAQDDGAPLARGAVLRLHRPLPPGGWGGCGPMSG